MESGRAGQSASTERCKGCGDDFADGTIRYYTGKAAPFEGGPYHLECLPVPKANDKICPHCGKEI